MECFLLVTTLWVFSVCLHEFGHALVAYYGGDYTVVDKGYLTLNPIRYTHPVLSLIMPVVFMMMGGIGLPGGAVYIERQLLRSRAWETAVSLAGPAMNLILVLIIGALFKFNIIANDTESALSVSFGFLLVLQVSALLLNLLPIPPLDGFQAIAPWLPRDMRESLYAVSNQTMWIMFLVLWYVEPVNNAFWHAVYSFSSWMGVSADTAYVGFKAFRFWEH